MSNARSLNLSGGPDNLLSGRAQRAGGYPIAFYTNLERSTFDFPTSCDLRQPGQQVVRATRILTASIFLFVLLLAISPIIHAQTNATDTSAPATASTNAAPSDAPVSVTSSDPNTPAISPAQQFNQAAGPANATAQPPPDIADIRPPFFYLHSWFWLWVALGVLGLIALLIFLWFFFKPKKWLSPKSAYDLALEKLEKARALLQEENPVPYAVLVSEAIRSYLGQRFQSPSTRRTTEEFLRQMERDRETPLAEHRDLLRDFLQSCDLVKFARYQPTLDELEQVHQRATTFVTATKPAPEPANERRP